jgi:hypothetical protein
MRKTTATVVKRAGGSCERCGRPTSEVGQLVRHHVVVGSEGVEDSLAVCLDCHRELDRFAPRSPDLTGRPRRSPSVRADHAD